MKHSNKTKKFQVGGSTSQDEIMQSRMQAVQQLVEQGVSDPEQIIQYLNYDDEGNEVGDFTEEEVMEYLQNIENPELPEYQSPYAEEEETEETEEEEEPTEEEGEEGVEEEEEYEEMKRGGSFMKFQAKNSQVDPLAMELAKRGFGQKPKKYKDLHYPEGMDFTLNPKGDAIFLGGYPTKTDSIVPVPNMPGIGIGYVKGKGYPVATDKKKKGQMQDWMKEHSTFYRDKEGYITPYYYMYGGNAPGGSHINFPQKKKGGSFKPILKKGGDTFGTGTESYLDELKNSFVTGMQDLVSNAQMQNQLKEMGLPNNALKMGGSKPKFDGTNDSQVRSNDADYQDYQNYLEYKRRKQQSGDVDYQRQRQSAGILDKFLPGYSGNPYGTGAWDYIGMGGNRDISGSDLLSAFPELSKSLSGSKPTITYKRGMFGLGPIKEGTISWEDWGPAGGQGTNINLNQKKQPFQNFFQGVTNTFQDMKNQWRGGRQQGQNSNMFNSQNNNVQNNNMQDNQMQDNQMQDNMQDNQKKPNAFSRFMKNVKYGRNTPGFMTDPNNPNYEISDLADPNDPDNKYRTLRSERIPFWKKGTDENKKARMSRQTQRELEANSDVDMEGYKYGGSKLRKFLIDGEVPLIPVPGGNMINATNSSGDIWNPTGSPSMGEELKKNAYGDIENNITMDSNQTEGMPNTAKVPEDDLTWGRRRNVARWRVEGGEDEVRKNIGRKARFNQWIQNAEAQGREYEGVRTGSAHNAGFGYMPQGISGQMGDYLPNTYEFRPTDKTPTQFTGMAPRTPSRMGPRYEGSNYGYMGMGSGMMFAQDGGELYDQLDDYESEYKFGGQTQYQVGGEYYLTDEEIARIEEMGGEVQIIK